MPKKRRKLSAHKKAAWDAMSLAVRFAAADHAGYAPCVSCGRSFPWREMDCGHFQPKARGNALYFFLPNVGAQCKGCNMGGGNPAGYTLYMLREYGEGMIERIQELSGVTIKYTRADYDAMKAHWQEQFRLVEAARMKGHKHKLEAWQ